jgi:tripartite-type tricarboxylate transporter receptor subunit TctC
MKRTTNIITLALLILSGFGFVFPNGLRAEYPEKPVSLIAVWPAGGTVDMTARALAEAAKKTFPKPIVVVNRPGAAGTIGTAEIIRSKPDGYTIGITGGAVLTIQPHRTKLPYGPPEEYTPIMNIVNLPVCLAVRADAPFNTIQEFIAHAKANPGKLSIGHSGIGAVVHLDAEIFKQQAKIDVTIAPFQGGPEALSALLGGHLDALSHHPGLVMPHVKAGKLKVLGVFEEKRNPLFPDTPTFREAGYDITMAVYYLIIGPKGIPSKAFSMLHDSLKKAMEEPAFRKPLEEGGFEVAYQSPEDILKRLKVDYENSSKLVDQLQLKAK